MSSWETLWRKWEVIGNSRNYGSPVFAGDKKNVFHCLMKVGDELRQARYHAGRWEGFASVGGGRFRSDPVVLGSRGRNLVEVFGTGLDGQLAYNVWRTSGPSWKGWEDLGKPAQGNCGHAGRR